MKASRSDFFASSKFVTGPFVKNGVRIDPTRLITTRSSTPSFFAAAFIPRSSETAVFSSFAKTAGVSESSIAFPAAMASGLPESVPA